MQAIDVKTSPFEGQKPGTSGLRKKVREFQEEHYLENFVQSVFDALGDGEKTSLVVGGDGRYHNTQAARTIIKMAIANGFEKIIVGRDALLSTPAASCVIRTHGSDGGIVLSASHNPGGPDADFGIKFNNASGSPAPESLTQSIFENTESIIGYRTLEDIDIPLNKPGTLKIGNATLDVVDPVEDYAALMQKCFDFDRLRDAFGDGRLSVSFDAMHAITGPYATRILQDMLGAKPGSVFNATPLEDFGGGHPDPNLVHAHELVTIMNQASAPVLGAASDGDGDRNLIHGPGFFVTPSDSLALLAQHAKFIPQFSDGLRGVARSMPTSAAVDRVAEANGFDCYVTPTGWKFFGNLLDDGRIGLCGEESFGTGGDHVREKDGLWTVLAWLSVVEGMKLPVSDIVTRHWQTLGRNYYCRHDFEGVDSDHANSMMSELSERLESLPGRSTGSLEIEAADSFSYTDPVDGSTTSNQGLQIHFKGGSRCVFRLSGTGTQGATIRMYLERYEPATGVLDLEGSVATQDLATAANELAGITRHTGRTKADVIT